MLAIASGAEVLNTFLPPPHYRKVWRMRKAVLLVGAVMAALVLAMSGPAMERGLSPRPAEAVTPALTVTVACQATPETTRVKNNRNTAKTIKTVGSIYQPYSEEPFRVDRRLGGGQSITFESGSGADRNELTGKHIYNNDVGTQEGARVTTPSGARFVDRCGS
jgi:hypothetical protein